MAWQSTSSSKNFDTTGRDAYRVNRTVEGKDACQKAGIDSLGIHGPHTVYRNLSFQQLFEHEQANKEGVVAKAEYGDTFTVDTGKYTGRSPKDRWIVLNPGSETAEHIDWNSINQATTPEVFDELYDKAVAYFNTRETAYVFDGYCGANVHTRKKIRFVHEMAWQQHFGTLFLQAASEHDMCAHDPAVLALVVFLYSIKSVKRFELLLLFFPRPIRTTHSLVSLSPCARTHTRTHKHSHQHVHSS